MDLVGVSILSGAASSEFVFTTAPFESCHASTLLELPDGGVTWTQAQPIDLPNPNSGLDAVALTDGRVVLIYNHTDKGRSPLNLAISRDGENFRMFHNLESEPGEYSYPAMIQGKNGDLHITYTWKRERIRYVRVPLADIPSE